MLASALFIIIADSIIKKESLIKGLTKTLVSPLMLVAYILYFVQIIIAVYIFRHGGELAVYTNLYIVFYSILGVLTGVLFFAEDLSFGQGVGVILALVGASLITLY